MTTPRTATHFYHGRSFFLLAVMLTFFLISPFFTANKLHSYFSSLFISLTILLCVDLLSRKRSIIIISLILAALSVAGYLIIFIYNPPNGVFVAHLVINTIFLMFMTIVVIATVASHHDITIDTLLGAICGYLLIGLIWSHFYFIIDYVQPDSFNMSLTGSTFRNELEHYIYFSFATLTTLGYGDILPRSNLARTLSWLEAATGQIYLAVWISQLVGLHIVQRIKNNRV